MDAVKLTGLWKQKDKNDNTFLSGKLNGIASVLIMPNTFKKGSKEPHCFLYIRPNEEKQGGEKPESRGNNL